MNKSLLLRLSSGFLLAACGGVVDPDSGDAAQLVVEQVLPGGQCANGGSQVLFGVDRDHDGLLSRDEVQGTEIICHGADHLGPEGGTGGTDPGSTDPGSSGAGGSAGTGASGGVGGSIGCVGGTAATGGTGDYYDGGSGGSGDTGGYYNGGSGSTGACPTPPCDLEGNTGGTGYYGGSGGTGSTGGYYGGSGGSGATGGTAGATGGTGYYGGSGGTGSTGGATGGTGYYGGTGGTGGYYYGGSGGSGATGDIGYACQTPPCEIDGGTGGTGYYGGTGGTGAPEPSCGGSGATGPYRDYGEAGVPSWRDVVRGVTEPGVVLEVEWVAAGDMGGECPGGQGGVILRAGMDDGSGPASGDGSLDSDEVDVRTVICEP